MFADRRDFMAALAATSLLPLFNVSALARQKGLDFGPALPFSWEELKKQALLLSRQPYASPKVATEIVHAIDYDAAGQIGYRTDRQLSVDPAGKTKLSFFHLSRAATTPIKVHVVDKGQSRELIYSESLFSMPAGHIARKLGSAGGFAGFRAMNANGVGDWLAFLGASYFRSAGALDQYGLSARGIAIDTATPGPEEFPAFTSFWLENGPDGALVIYALLDGPSVTGAYRFINRHTDEGVFQDVSLSVHLRRDVGRLGFAPLTSMFWYGEGNRTQGIDWRPEIHDSDGLALWTGSGERIWRPLINQPRVMANSFADVNPRGFGLMQRDRNFSSYEDDGVFYEKRPSLWIEPQGDWGRGAVELVEIPTIRETDDNIVAFWRPEGPAKAGNSYVFDYRMNWIGPEKPAPGAARVIHTFAGVGGRPGLPPIPDVRKIVVDFEGKALMGLGRDSGVEPVISISRGEIRNVYAHPVVGATNRWRLNIDVGTKTPGPTDIRAYLRYRSNALTETWLYQLWPEG